MWAALVAALLALPVQVDYSLSYPVISVAAAAVVENPPKTIKEQIDIAAVAAGMPIATAEAIAQCESGMAQFNADGTVLTSRTGDQGVFQVNHVHDAETKALDLNVARSAADNISYAMLLWERNGTRDWSASAGCWEKLITTTKT